MIVEQKTKQRLNADSMVIDPVAIQHCAVYLRVGRDMVNLTVAGPHGATSVPRVIPGLSDAPGQCFGSGYMSICAKTF